MLVIEDELRHFIAQRRVSSLTCNEDKLHHIAFKLRRWILFPSKSNHPGPLSYPDSLHDPSKWHMSVFGFSTTWTTGGSCSDSWVSYQSIFRSKRENFLWGFSISLKIIEFHSFQMNQKIHWKASSLTHFSLAFKKWESKFLKTEPQLMRE